MAVSAKFKVSKTTLWGPTDPDEFSKAVKRCVEAGVDHDPVLQQSLTAEVEMVPDYAEGRNKEWATYTPAGVLRLTVSNPKALDELLHNGPYVTLTLEVSKD